MLLAEFNDRFPEGACAHSALCHMAANRLPQNALKDYLNAIDSKTIKIANNTDNSITGVISHKEISQIVDRFFPNAERVYTKSFFRGAYKTNDFIRKIDDGQYLIAAANQEKEFSHVAFIGKTPGTIVYSDTLTNRSQRYVLSRYNHSFYNTDMWWVYKLN